jgi:hypothetical protein
MSKTSVSLLLASLVVGMPTGSQAGPVTWKYIDDSLHIAVDSLNRMRVFSKACGLSATAEPVALRFMADFSIKAGVSMVEVSKIVQDAYVSAPEANTGFKRDCEMKYVEFWTDAFRQRSQELDESLTRYLQQK